MAEHVKRGEWRDAPRRQPPARTDSPRVDQCPACSAQRRELVIAPGRFYCPHCQTTGDGPYDGPPPPPAAESLF